MRAHHASASRIWLLAHCTYWAHRSVDLPPDQGGPAAEHGSEVHERVSARIQGRPWTAGGTARAEHQAKLVLEWLDVHAPRIYASEAALVYDVAKDATEQRLLESARDYGDISPTQIPGSADLLWRDPKTETVVVLDIKTGQAPPVDNSPQLETLALAATRLFGLDSATVAHVFVDDDKAWAEWADVDAITLDGHRSRLAGLLDRATRATPEEPRPGPHCGWCPARAVCPKAAETALALPRVAIRSPHDIARVYPLLKPIIDMATRIKEKVAEYVETNGPTELTIDGERFVLKFQETGGGEYLSVKDIPDDVAATLREIGVIKEKKKGQSLHLHKVEEAPKPKRKSRAK